MNNRSKIYDEEGNGGPIPTILLALQQDTRPPQPTLWTEDYTIQEEIQNRIIRTQNSDLFNKILNSIKSRTDRRVKRVTQIDGIPAAVGGAEGNNKHQDNFDNQGYRLYCPFCLPRSHTEISCLQARAFRHFIIAEEEEEGEEEN